jgi:hypothetical protein
MLDFSNILNNPNIDVQTFIGPANSLSVLEWRTWRKPRGAKFIYMIGVGSGSSGGCGINSAATSGAGAGGPSGAQTVVMIPAMFVPDVLYVQTGAGGQQPAVLVSAAVNVAGVTSYVCISPYTSVPPAGTILFANGGQIGTAAATSTTGGTATVAASAASIFNMPLAGRGFYQFFAGQAGTAGGTPAGGSVAQTYPTTGLMVQGGAGGGGSSTSGQAGGAITLAGFGDSFPAIAGGIAAVTSTPAGAGSGGTMLKMFQYTGGAGGGGSTTTAGGLAGAGGNGAPGCGGGGAGGSNTTVTTLARPGDGGPGFVYIFTT